MATSKAFQVFALDHTLGRKSSITDTLGPLIFAVIYIYIYIYHGAWVDQRVLPWYNWGEPEGAPHRSVVDVGGTSVACLTIYATYTVFG